ncbi:MULTISPECIES: copper chaperone PCu(A)C [unclassified Phenylobacterium]|uniref:copper chaperone PCu(A)C n=1 Tax=unclassified Phenylobacterium TaxID=2640670 RepID=UPI00083B6E0E|nr:MULTISPECIES: copper chaperone PCu(A)C [unclassified Phenylobacterium]
MRLPLATLAVVAFATAAQAAPAVEAAWTRPAAQGGTGAGFMTLKNSGAKADALVAVSSPLARTVQIHQSSMSGGMASMKQVARVAVPPGGSVAFAPGGYHLMFLGLTRPVKTGDAVPATLTFASGAKVKVSFVAGMGAPAAAGSHHH